MKNWWNRTITKDESRDSGMALVLLCLIVFLSTRRLGFVAAALVLQVVNMVVPQAFRYVAVVWLGLSHLLGAVMSRVLLSLVFFLVVTPIGLLRRLSGKDTLHLRAFKASDASVMLMRRHTFVARDLEKPY
jgi:hypothetical protein